MNRPLTSSFAAVALAMCPALVSAGVKIELGKLQCAVVQSSENIVSETLHLNCTFTKPDGSMGASYVGEVKRKGLTLGKDVPKSLAWIVATVGESEKAILTGTYFGAEAGA